MAKGIPRLFHKRWNMNPNKMNRMGTNAMDHPKGIPHSPGGAIEKLTRGVEMCSIDTLYKDQANAPC